MSRTPPRTATVLAKRLVSPNMWRIRLGGPGLADFPADQDGAYIKLHFAQAHSERPLLRTYTVRAQHHEAIDVDVVRHAHGGPASHWAETVTAGESIDIGGPGPAKRLDHRADWFLLAGDMTALPAMAANIEALPATARGHAIIEVIEPGDIQAVDGPAGLAIDWRVNPNPGQQPELLADAVRALDWPDGEPSAWAACEFSAMRALRTHLLTERQLDRSALYISSYWQLGYDESRHKQAKRADAESSSAMR